MPPVYYKPADAIQWLEPNARPEVAKKKKPKETKVEKQIADALKGGFQATVDFGKGALADLTHKRVGEVFYVVHDDSFEAVTLSSHKKVPFEDVTSIIAEDKDRFRINHKNGHLTLKPLAHIVAGRLRVPIGWKRNGVEVPYILLAEEIAAHCGLEIESE